MAFDSNPLFQLWQAWSDKAFLLTQMQENQRKSQKVNKELFDALAYQLCVLYFFKN